MSISGWALKTSYVQLVGAWVLVRASRNERFYAMVSFSVGTENNNSVLNYYTLKIFSFSLINVIILSLVGEEIFDCESIQDGDCLIISDKKPYKLMNEDADGNPKTVGPYIIEEILGSGEFSTVYAGRHIATGEKMSLKFTSKSGIKSMQDVQREMSEYQILQSLNHRNITKQYSVSIVLCE